MLKGAEVSVVTYCAFSNFGLRVYGLASYSKDREMWNPFSVKCSSKRESEYKKIS